uniref:Uncharacterized protein n=1 Tax=Magallana gigas TaxID=29159 RepID=K1RHF1_MAGGI
MASNVPSTPTSQLSDKRINENENVLARKKRKHSRKTIDILLTIHLADRFYQKPASWIFGVVKTWKNERGDSCPILKVEYSNSTQSSRALKMVREMGSVDTTKFDAVMDTLTWNPGPARPDTSILVGSLKSGPLRPEHLEQLRLELLSQISLDARQCRVAGVLICELEANLFIAAKDPGAINITHMSSYKFTNGNHTVVFSQFLTDLQLLERKVKDEAARVQMEYVKKQLDNKKMKAELLESEFKVKAEINRRQSEIQPTMDVLDADMNLSEAEAELKIFDDEVENSKIFDTFSNYEEQDPQERTEQYVTEQQPFIASVYPPQESLVPQTLKQQTDGEQTFLKQTIDQQDSQQPTDVRLYKEQ